MTKGLPVNENVLLRYIINFMDTYSYQYATKFEIIFIDFVIKISSCRRSHLISKVNIYKSICKFKQCVSKILENQLNLRMKYCCRDLLSNR